MKVHIMWHTLIWNETTPEDFDLICLSQETQTWNGLFCMKLTGLTTVDGEKFEELGVWI